MGEGGRWIEHGNRGNYIAIGWIELAETYGDFAKLVSSGKLKEAYSQVYSKDSELVKSIGCGQIIRFVKEIEIGHVVFVPDSGKQRVLIGRVTGPNIYREHWEDDCSYLNRRTVEWMKTIDRGKLPEKLKSSLGSMLTVFSLDSRAEQIQLLISGQAPKQGEKTVTGESLANLIVDRLFDLSPREFEEFVKQVLNVIGFEAATMSYVADGGVDVTGNLSAEGLAEVQLRVQVKRTSCKTGVEDVLKLRGALGADDHGAVISLSGFTAKAIEEAEHSGKKPILLVDGGRFAELLLRHFDEIDQKYKTILKVEKKELPIWEQYYSKT
jgi:predicted Mrr-cat superfamily restriction endonuclease